jgi:hypothetical protein
MALTRRALIGAGFKDGTNNLRAEDIAALGRHVWVGSEGPGWMRDGSYLVTRRIRMLIEAWDRASLADQEQTIGRTKTVGAPMGARHEHARVDLRSRAIPADAHIRLASPGCNGGVRILRRGYSFTDGFDDELGQLDAGLFFIAYQRAIRTGSSCSSSAGSAPATRSTSTSSTPRARCSRCHRACAGGTTGSAAGCSGPMQTTRARLPARPVSCGSGSATSALTPCPARSSRQLSYPTWMSTSAFA